MRRRTRLFAIAEHLRGRRTGITAAQLAERFGVTLRTIYRDLDALRDAALPLRADRGRGGGYALEKHYALPPVNFTAREAALLLAVGDWAARMRWLPFTETLAAALDKVRGALGVSAQRELAALVPQLQFVGIPAVSAPEGIRAALEEAWFQQQPLALTYRSAEGARTERVVRVHGVLTDRTRILLDCEDLDLTHRPSTRRHFRLDRIEAARVLPLR